MSAYFNSHYISNSDLKAIKKRLDVNYSEPANLEEIFDLGSLIHAILLEPHNVDFTGFRLFEGDRIISYSEQDFTTARKMAKTVLKDNLCSNLFMISDFKREHEFYKENVHGINGRCKMDGSSKGLSVCFEYKGLSITSERAFDEAIMRLDYDQGAAWYLDVSGYNRVLIAGVSKKNPDLIFKRLIDRNHKFYKSGEEKVVEAVKLFKTYYG